MYIKLVYNIYKLGGCVINGTGHLQIVWMYVKLVCGIYELMWMDDKLVCAMWHF